MKYNETTAAETGEARDVASVPRRKLIQAAAASVTLASVGLPALSQTRALRPLRIVLDYSPAIYAQHLPYWLALSRGWFAEAGLDVKIEASRGSNIVLQLVMSERADIVNVSSAALVQAVATQNVGLKMVAMFAQRDLLATAWFESTGIKSLRDVEGRTLGVVPGSAPAQLWPVLARKAGVDFSKVKVVNTDAQALFAQWGAGTFDVLGSFSLGTTADEQFAKGGKKITAVAFADYLPIYGHGLAATSSIIQKDPATVRGVVRALQEAWNAMIADPQGVVLEAAKVAAANVDGAPAPDAITRGALQVIPSRMLAEDVAGKPIGSMTDDGWTKMVDVMMDAYKFPKRPALGDLYTNAFLKD